MSAAAPCAHSWRDDYVCKLCSAVKRGAAPLWVWELTMKAGPWAVLLALWTFADGGPDSRPVWPHNDTWRGRCRNIATSTLQGHMNTLLAQGWIRLRDIDRREFDLAWSRPFEQAERTPRTPENLGTPRKPGGPKTQTPPPENLGGNARKPGPNPPKTWAHTYELPGDLPASDLVNCATSPAPSESTSPNGVTQESHNQAHRVDGPVGARQDLAPHTREVLDRAQGRRPEPEARSALAEVVAAVSEAAAYQLAAGSPKWGPDMLAFQLSTGVSDDELVAMFEHWEAAPRPKPPMDKLWWWKGGGRAWLDTHFGLGKAAPAPLTDTSSADNDAIWAAAKAANS